MGTGSLSPEVITRASLGEWASVERMQEVIKRCLATGEGMRPGPEPRWLVLRGWMSDVWDPPVFRKELNEIKDTVEGGATFAYALRKFPKTFDELYINLVSAGEIGGISST